VRVCVIGLGKIGLPLAVQIASKNHRVIGLEINPGLVRDINNGVCPFPEESNLDQRLTHVIQNGKLIATNNLELAIKDSEVILFAIPLFTNMLNEPDFENYDQLLESISALISEGTLLLFETTLPVGTTRNRFMKLVSEKSNLIPGDNVFGAFSPERVTTGRVFSDLRKYPKIVGGVDFKSSQRAKVFYEQFLEFDTRPELHKPNGVWEVESSEAAEFVKLAETTYRDVNIGLANQFAIHANQHGISFDEVRLSANSQPYSFIHEPGIAVGGHCIPVYPHFYAYSDKSASIVRSAREVNSKMPDFFVGEIEKAVGNLEGIKVLILGVSYRENVKETAYSGSLALLEIFKSKNALVYGLDSKYDFEEIKKLGFIPLFDKSEIDVVVVQTKDLEFRKIDFKNFTSLKLIADGRNFLKDIVSDLNIDYFSLG
jgi:UDP-N-acetyl-D-glucosamine dehydrogenase